MESITRALCICGDPTCDIPYGCCHCGCGALTELHIRTNARKRMHKGMPKRYAHGHQNFIRNAIEYFWSFVDKCGPDECWEWLGNRNLTTNYGRYTAHSKTESTHRLAYEFTFGPIPTGKFIRHRCDNPPCCNPNHLLIGTHADNMADKARRGRLVIYHGANHVNAKLTEDEVRQIRQEVALGINRKSLAKKYKVSLQTIYNTSRGKTYADVA